MGNQPSHENIYYGGNESGIENGIEKEKNDNGFRVLLQQYRAHRCSSK